MSSQPEKNVIICQGKKADGTQCKAEIQKKCKYCGKCKTRVDPQWFSSAVITCQGQGDDGSICGNIFDEQDEFCTMCTTPRPKPFDRTEPKIYSADNCVREEGSSMVLDHAASLNSGKNSTLVLCSSDQKTNTDNSHLDNEEKRNDTRNVDNSVDKEEEKRTQKEVIKEEKKTHESAMTVHRVLTELLGAASLPEHQMETGEKKDEKMERQEKANEVDLEKEAGLQDQLKSKMTGVEGTNTKKEDKSIERKGEEGTQTISNERGKRTDEHDMKMSVIATVPEETASQIEQLRKATEETKGLEHTGQEEKKQATVSTIKDEKDEMKRKEDDNQMIQSERDQDSQEKRTNDREAFQGGLQEQYSNRIQISANQGTNKDNTLLQGRISSLSDPNSIMLHFHVLVSPDFKWKMGKHNVHIDIYRKSSKCWYSYKMEHVKQVQDYEEMHHCILVEKQEVFQSGFKYIYAISNQQNGKRKLEKYYKSRWTFTKHRSCLLSANRVDMNEYHQYDGIMNRNLDHVKKCLKGADYIKKLEEDAKISAEIFTQEKLLSTGYIVHKLDQETLKMLDMLLLGLEKIYLQDAKCWSSSQAVFKEKMATAILSHILKSLESEIQILLDGYTETQQQAERRMQVALFILTVIGRFKLLLSAHNKSLLARSLLLRPHHQTGALYDLAVVKSLEEKRELGIYMADFCNSFQMNDKDPSWLFCIPLLHFLSGHVMLDPPSDDRRHDGHCWWGINLIESTVEKFRCCPKINWTIALKEIVSCLSPLFELDYFLPRTLMFALQLNEVKMVIQTKTVPPEVCIATCIKEINSKNYSSPTEDQQIISTIKMLKEFLAKFEAPGRWDDSLLLQHAYLTRIFAEEMVRITFEKKNLHELLREVVQVFLEAVALYDTTQKKLLMKEDDLQNQMLQNVRPKVKDWLSKNFSSFTSTDFTGSLMRWQDMLCSKDFKSPVVAKTWNTFIADDFKMQWERERKSGHACESTLVMQYCSLVESLHPCMQSSLRDLAFNVIPATYHISVQTLGESERGYFGTLMSWWYENEWEVAMKQNMEEDRLILQHILKWMPFSRFLKMFYGDERKFLSQKCITKIKQAISVIDDKVKTLEDGKVTIRDLTEMIKADGTFLELTSIITKKGFDTKKALLVRQIEVDSYKKQMKYVTTLAQLCQHIPTG